MSFVVSTISPEIEAWKTLQASSTFASPFQSPEYYYFLKSQPNHQPLILTVSRPSSSDLCPLSLLLIDIQYNTPRFLTARAIVHGGPLILPDCPPEALAQLLAESINLSRRNSAVYFEIRPYFDYSQYADIFASSGMEYIDYCDCYVDTSSLDAIDRNIQPRKLTQIRSALRQSIDFVDNPTDRQIADFYELLKRRHWHRTRRPIPSLRYFLDLAHTPVCSILLAYHKGVLISGCVALNGVATYYYYVAGEDNLYRSLDPSSVITYHFLQYAHKKGSQHASLMGAGRLSIPFGVRDFKTRMGGVVLPYGRYIHLIRPFIYRLASLALNLLHPSNT